MDIADTGIVNSFVKLTNFFAANLKYSSINSLEELWAKHGEMIARMMQCETLEFKSSDIFYEVLYRKIRLVNGEMAAALDPEKAAGADLFEICKFYALYLEYLRKDHSTTLTEVLEKIPSESNFNSNFILGMFAYFDRLYSDDSADNWWFCLRPQESTDMFEVASTPRRNLFDQSAFATPTATARRLRTATSSSRRSPIAEAVDSPTMKFLRSERELKQAKKKISDLQQTLDEVDAERNEIVEKNIDLKKQVTELKGSAAGNRDTAQNASNEAEKLRLALETKKSEADALSQQLEESRAVIRTMNRQLEELEVEKDRLTAKLQTVTQDRDTCMKQMRDIRNANEQEFGSWRKREEDMNSQLRESIVANGELVERLGALEELKAGLTSENERLNRAFEDLSIVSSRSMQDADNAKTLLKESREKHQETVQRMCDEQAERMKMADATIERLQSELNEERNDKRSLQELLNELNEQVLKDDKASHEQSEGFLSIRACLEASKRQIEQLKLEVASKEATNAIDKEQKKRMADFLKTEAEIREKSAKQHADCLALLEHKLKSSESEVVSLTHSNKIVEEKYSGELAEMQKQIEQKDEAIKRLTEEYEKFKKADNDGQNENRFLTERIKLLEENATGRFNNSKSSCDSLIDILAKENTEYTEEEMFKQVAATPRKSVAFHVDMENDTTIKEKPLGFRTEMNNARQSISSINDESFERSSLTRSSLRSDTFTLASAHSSSGFKMPYTPSGTSKDRVGVLTARNEKVKPHLQSSYVTEMMDVSSPSADEENVRKGGTMKPKKSRRESLVSLMLFKKK
ncbi:unnamed protein product [Caenorhabditis sp. 36 PRJEB53466]|nr:unnamed protein product [Caenorhabditis sp. 36 PRJEB53466]